MSPSLPQISVEGSGESIRLVVGGNVLSTNVQFVRSRVLDIIGDNERTNPSWRSLDLDLRAAQMIDSTGLNFLVAVARHLKKHGVELRISVTSANIAKSFSFIRLDRQALISVG